jgi:ABC-2 type transport system permease protein
VPPIFFVGAFSIACTTLLWAPLYQFLFVGYWLWTNLNPGEAIPTLNATLLSPAENYVITGFFHFSAFIPIDKGFYPTSSVWLGTANIATLLACGAIALFAAWRILLAQARRG